LGEKITIISMADGTPFDMDKEYKCALNSYRGNGGGELLTKGAGISQEDLPNRVLTASQYDIRYYMIDYIQKLGTVSPRPLNQWKFIPEAWTVPAAARDSLLLFGKSRK
jgi:2',3'-cyclic-nucleotide 2'-phosphodiesterase/3'-nucleotidase